MSYSTYLLQTGATHYRSRLTKITRKSVVLVVAIIAAVILLAAPAFAAVTFDSPTGTGFVGKGDVQTALGWNNKQLQDNADSLVFAAVSTVVTEVSWTCTNSNNQNLQQRERTTTTSIEGVVTSVARVKNQITGFNLNGYEGSPTESTTTEGNQLNSCPSGPWSLTTPAGDPEEVSSTGALTVNGVAL